MWDIYYMISQIVNLAIEIPLMIRWDHTFETYLGYCTVAIFWIKWKHIIDVYWYAWALKVLLWCRQNRGSKWCLKFGLQLTISICEKVSQPTNNFNLNIKSNTNDCIIEDIVCLQSTKLCTKSNSLE